MAKILIVDDDPDIVESMRVVLKSKGHQLMTAGDGDEGIAKAKSKTPDLIILDVMMPNKEGFEVAREIKAEPSLKSTPILMLTAVREKTGLDFRKEAGDEVWLPVDDYCEKPVDHEILITKVEQLLQKK